MWEETIYSVIDAGAVSHASVVIAAAALSSIVTLY